MCNVNESTIMKSRTRLAIAIFGLGVAVGVVACTNTSKPEGSSATPPIDVVVGYPSGGHNQGVEISGRVESSRMATISTKLMGYITSVKVKVGDRVKKGELLVSIESEEILAKRSQAQAMVVQAEAAFTNAEKDYERYQQLYSLQSASAKELENVKLMYISAKSRLDAAQQARNEASALLSYTQLRAPFAGVVTQKMADQGTMATPGMPILLVEQHGEYQVRATLPEAAISKIGKGAAVVVNISSIGKTFKAQVDELSPSSLASGGAYEVLINVPNSAKSSLFSGQYANVTVEGMTMSAENTSASAVFVPESSIVRRDHLTGLYTISTQGTAILRWVRIGKQKGSKVEVLSGIAANEQLIVKSSGKLYNGAPVKIMK